MTPRRVNTSSRVPSDTWISTIINSDAELDGSFVAQQRTVVGEVKMTEFNTNLSMGDEFKLVSRCVRFDRATGSASAISLLVCKIMARSWPAARRH